MQDINIQFKIISINNISRYISEIESLLSLAGLLLDKNIENFIIAIFDKKVVACGGIDCHIIKCVAVHPHFRGYNITVKLVEYIINYAYEKNQFHLFLYTTVENEKIFQKCGFYPLINVPNTLVLMENTPVGIKKYCSYLAQNYKKPGNSAAIVMNANPFTLGHYHLIEQVAKDVDWLHLFVLSEDCSVFSTKTRYELVRAGIAHLNNVIIHLGNDYLISRATFPAYFLKNNQLIDQVCMATDLLLFRNYIAGALNITRRYVGSEPACPVTCAYNEAMKKWLTEYDSSQSLPIEVVEIPRIAVDDQIISASKVRELLLQNRSDEVRKLVPDSTWSYLIKHYPIK